MQGDGFFQVAMPDGSTSYTRDGSFGLDASGQLSTSGGLPVQSDTGAQHGRPGQLDQRAISTTPDSLWPPMQPAPNRWSADWPSRSSPTTADLQANGQNLWSATAASGGAIGVAQGAPNAPVVVAGALEGSNVDMADEFTRLIQAQRGYQMNAKVVQAWDDVQRMANELDRAHDFVPKVP